MDTVELFDRVPLSGVRRDSAGNLVCSATVARAGVYEYAGFELGKPDKRVIRVYRPAEEVFHRDAMRSLAGAPVTIDHPKELVTTANWKDYAMGETSSDDIVRDGEAIKVPFLLRDENAINAVEDGKHELSPGYTALIDWTAGQTESGEAYDAVCRRIRVNHLAIVDKARGGEKCRIGDGKPKENKKVDTKIILVDGLNVEVTEAAERAIIKLQDANKAVSDNLAEAQTKLTDAEKQVATLTAEKTALEAQVKTATDPAALEAAATERASLCDKAKALVPAIKLDGKASADIRKEVVDAKLGDAAKDFTDDQIAAAFATLAAGVKVDVKGKDSLRDAISGATVSDDDMAQLVKDHEAALQGRYDHLSGAHRNKSDKE